MRMILLAFLIYSVSLLVFLNVKNQRVVIPLPTPEVHVFEYEKIPKVYVEVPLYRVSAYNPVPRQTDGDPTISSCGPNRERQIAVSRDLFFDENGRKHLCGVVATVVTNRGEVFEDYVIWDTMNPRYTNTADILFPTLDESVAYAFGITQGTLLIRVD